MPRKSLKSERERAAAILDRLHQEYPDADCTLDFGGDPFRLLVAAILAAQCTDARVNLVTPALFERFPDIDAFADSSPSEIEPYIKSCGLFRNKAKSIHGAACYLREQEESTVPHDLNRLLKIPGVGRKIANLLIGDVFGGQAVVVDTHCGRISRLIGFTRSENPAVIERDLEKILPADERAAWGHLMVTHGRECCKARRPDCDHCVICPLCEFGSGKAGRS